MIWLTFLAGTLLGSAFTYFLTIHFKKLNAIEERIRAEKLESYHEGRIATKGELTVERNSYVKQKGIIHKVESVVITERILLEGIPITPFYEQEHRVDEHIDARELGLVADKIRVMAGLPDLTKMGFGVIQKSLNKRI